MPCDKCNSNRMGKLSAKCSDAFSFDFDQYNYHGYVPAGYNIGNDDYIEFTFCFDCGKIQGSFPLPPNKIEYGVEGVDPYEHGINCAIDNTQENPFPESVWPIEHEKFKAGFDSYRDRG